MTDNRRRPADRQRRCAVGLGAAAGGMLVATIGQLAMAPSARADDFADITSDIQQSIGAGEADLGRGASEFSADNVPAGLDYDLTGVESILLGPGYDILADGTAALTGSGDVSHPFDFQQVALPHDLTGFATFAQTFFDDGEAYLTTAGADFTTGDFSDGALATVLASEDFVSAPDEAIIGLTEALLSGL